MDDQTIRNTSDPRYAPYVDRVQHAFADAIAAADPAHGGDKAHPAAIEALCMVIAALAHEYRLAATREKQQRFVDSVAGAIGDRLKVISERRGLLH